MVAKWDGASTTLVTTSVLRSSVPIGRSLARDMIAVMLSLNDRMQSLDCHARRIVVMSPKRTKLPDRRGCETLDVHHNGQRFHVSIGRFRDGSLAEIFINGGKSGSDLEAVARDAAVTLSIALQYGVPLDPICHAVTRNADGSPSSIVGAVLERLVK
jgi:hypothetical protein